MQCFRIIITKLMFVFLITSVVTTAMLLKKKPTAIMSIMTNTKIQPIAC